MQRFGPTHLRGRLARKTHLRTRHVGAAYQRGRPGRKARLWARRVRAIHLWGRLARKARPWARHFRTAHRRGCLTRKAFLFRSAHTGARRIGARRRCVAARKLFFGADADGLGQGGLGFGRFGRGVGGVARVAEEGDAGDWGGWGAGAEDLGVGVAGGLGGAPFRVVGQAQACGPGGVGQVLRRIWLGGGGFPGVGLGCGLVFRRGRGLLRAGFGADDRDLAGGQGGSGDRAGLEVPARADRERCRLLGDHCSSPSGLFTRPFASGGRCPKVSGKFGGLPSRRSTLGAAN